MKYLFLTFITITFSCTAQTISLETAAQCLTNSNCQNYTYARDINNSLDQYLGIWKGQYDGKIFELKFNKGLYEEMNIKRDILIGRLRIKDLNGLVLYDSFNESDDAKTKFHGLNFQSDLKAYRASFIGNSLGCGESGTIYLSIKQSNPNQMSILQLQNNNIVKEGGCPSNFYPTIPYKTSISLVKQ